jgi:ParB-like chromosome segregation protein Spo0J
MRQIETGQGADLAGEEVLLISKPSSTESNSHTQHVVRAEADGVPLDRRLAKVRKILAPAKPNILWRKIMKVHAAAEKLRPATDDECRALRGDLHKNGQIEPVLLLTIAGGPKLLGDGRTRLDLLEDNGVQVITADGELLVPHKVVSLPDDAAALSLVLSLNLYRRHLSLDDRRNLVRTVLTASPEKSDRQVSKIVGLSHPTVTKERKYLESQGDVVKLSTSSDSTGRKQPRERKLSPRLRASATAEKQVDMVVTDIAEVKAANMKKRRAEKPEILKVEVERFSAALIKVDETLARDLYHLLWDDEREALMAALGRGLGLDDGDDARGGAA